MTRSSARFRDGATGVLYARRVDSANLDQLKRLDEFTLADLEAVRLVLRGDSVIDWHRLNLENEEEARQFLRAQELRPDEPADRKSMEIIKTRSDRLPAPALRVSDPEADRAGVGRRALDGRVGRGHRQMCACTILKCMHIIHHLEGRELLFMLPLSDQEVFHMVEEKVYRVIGGHARARAFRSLEFVGGRKNKDSLYTKLLSKQDTIAAQIYDKLRFRIVTRAARRHLSRHPIPHEAPLPVQLRHPGTEHQLDLPLQDVLPEERASRAACFPTCRAGGGRRAHAERQQFLLRTPTVSSTSSSTCRCAFRRKLLERAP